MKTGRMGSSLTCGYCSCNCKKNIAFFIFNHRMVMDIRPHPFSEDILIAEVHHLLIPGSKDSYEQILWAKVTD
jgi:hypothetical protein